MLKFKVSLIPDFNRLEESVEIANKYDASFEYNDFFLSAVYDNEEEINRRVEAYLSLGRDTSRDTMHGVFLDITVHSSDASIANYSKAKIKQSMEIAKRLGVKGVVFHTGLLAGFKEEIYARNWLGSNEQFFRKLCSEYAPIEVYMENMFDRDYELLHRLANQMSDVDNFGVCLDYAHAALSDIQPKEWLYTLAKHIKHMHINDNDLRADRHWSVGKGQLDWVSFLQTLDDLVKKGNMEYPSVLLELKSLEAFEESMKFLENAYVTKKQPSRVAMEISQSEFRKILSIGINLTTEKDRNRLLEKILKESMSITNCDAGTLYVLENDALKFKVMKTLSMGISQGENGEEINLPPVPLREENVCAYCAIHRQVINIADVWNNDTFDFSGPKKYDSMTGYHTQSMLVIPLANHEGEVIGVMQLLNALDREGDIIVFDKEFEFIILSLASQAAIALSNMRYTEELKEQLWSFAEGMATAIDERTPYNATHTRKVADYCDLIVDQLNKEYEAGTFEETFDLQRKEQLRMGALLHDIGKMIVPLSVMNKSTRLEQQIEFVYYRFMLFESYIRIRILQGKITKEEGEALQKHLDDILETVEKYNIKGYMTDDDLDYVEKISKEYVEDPDNQKIPILLPEELECLRIRKGTLTAKERATMENHVVMTRKILEKVRFNNYFKDCITWASQHHETLDGEGYPDRLTGENLALESRILAVADIFDALTSKDRPYKEPMPRQKAFAILDSMVLEGKLDGRVVSAIKECVKDLEE